jgi:hypothetical protein
VAAVRGRDEHSASAEVVVRYEFVGRVAFEVRGTVGNDVGSRGTLLGEE